MMSSPNQKRIVIFDRQDYWRSLSKRILTAEGHAVEAYAGYDDAKLFDLENAKPDLVILGCADIASDEQEFIARLLGMKQNLLVLCASLPLPAMRALFVAGARDVADKPYDPNHVVAVVEQALQSIVQSNGYQAAQSGGVK